MPRNTKLKNAVKIISGYTFRSAISEGQDGNIAVIQAKNVTAGIPIVRGMGLFRVSFSGKTASATVQTGDVLLTSRGTIVGGFKATTVADPEPNMIAASSVYILRPNVKILSPDFLAMFLNSEAGQEMLRRIATGSNIQTLLMKELQEMEIVLPPSSVQEALASVYKNISLQTRLLNKRKLLLEDILASIIKSTVHA